MTNGFKVFYQAFPNKEPVLSSLYDKELDKKFGEGKALYFATTAAKICRGWILEVKGGQDSAFIADFSKDLAS